MQRLLLTTKQKLSLQIYQTQIIIFLNYDINATERLKLILKEMYPW